MKKMVLVILLFPILLSAQQFKFGFDIDMDYYFVSNGTRIRFEHQGVSLPNTYNLDLVFNLINKLSIQSKVGYALINGDFRGYELGMNGLYDIKNNLYLSGGILFHSNEASQDGNSSGSLRAKILFLDIGVGYKLTKVFRIECNYYYPVNSKPTSYLNNFGLNTLQYPNLVRYTVKSIIRLNFVFLWDL